MGTKQRIAILTLVLIMVFLLFSCVSRDIPKIVLPNLEDPEVLDALVQIITGDGDAAASDHIDENSPFSLEGEDTFSFSITPIVGVEFTVIFREQAQATELVDGVLVYEIDVSATASGIYEVIIRATRATLIPPDQINPRNDNTKEATLWIEVFNQPPLKPFNPQPEDGAENQPIEGVVLRWDCGDPEGDPLTYMVYLSTEEDDLEWIATTTETNHPLPELAYDTQYFWRVDADDGRTSEPRELTEGDVWTFNTQTQPFTLTLNRNNNAWGIVAGGGTYVAGQVANIQATPTAGYRFVHWTHGGTIISTQANHSYTMPAENVTLVADFEEVPAELYTLTLNRNNNAWGTVAGGGTYAAGQVANIQATPTAGYRFVQWTHGGSVISTQANYNYMMPAENVTLVANFEELPPDAHTLTLNRNNNAWGTVTGGGAYVAGAEVEITAIPNTGYRFVEWEDSFGSTVSTDTTHTFTMPAADVTLLAIFEQAFTLTLNRNNNTWGTVTGGGTYAAGAEVEITATPNAGYRFVEWEDSFGSTVSTDTTHTFTIPAANVTLLAIFEQIFALTLKGNPEDGGVLEGAGNYHAGAQVEVRADDAEGFDFVHWTFGTSGGELVSVEENFSYVMPAKNVTLVATFHKPVTAITVSGEGGRVSVGVGVPLQMIAEVNPENATNKEVTWSVENVGGISPRENRAEITQTGILKGLTTGIVDVKATAKDGSGVEGIKRITVTPPEMILVYGGTFQMGDEEGDLHESGPTHTVHLTYDFWVGTYPVTFYEYDAFCDDTDRAKPGDEDWGRGSRPVVNVTWWDAIAFCNWLSEQQGLPVAYILEGEPEQGSFLDAAGSKTEDITQVVGYRLITEAEWEYSASGGNLALPIPPRYLYAGGDDIDDVGWFTDNSGGSTQPVGKKAPNQLGLYDMTGNVTEWCHDSYQVYTTETKTNPIGHLDHHSNKMVRGGHWNNNAGDCRLAYRFHKWSLGNSQNNRGFRIAKTHF